MFGFKARCKDFDVLQQSGVGGTHALWHTFDAVQKKTNVQATVWVLDKKALEKTWFKKDSQGFKTFITYMKREPIPAQPLNLNIKILQPIDDDSAYLVYVTTRVVSTLFGLFTRNGDLGIASQAQSLPFNFSPDLLFYGFLALLQDLSELHSAGLTFGNLTPANIAVLPTGELALVGFAMTENNALQFSFNDDSGAWFRPSAFFLTNTQINSKASTAATDCSQLAFSLFSVFGNRAVNFSDGAFPAQKDPGFESGIVDFSGKLMGVCPPFQSWGISVAAAVQNAGYNSAFWEGFGGQSASYYSLSKFGQICGQMIQCARNEVSNAGILLNQLINTQEYLIMYNIKHVELLGGFKNSRPSRELVEAIMGFLDVASKCNATAEFGKTVLLARAVRAFQAIDLHAHAIYALININYQLQCPFSQIFLILEPIVLAQTQQKYRTLYEKAAKNASYAAFSGLELTQEKGKIFGYSSPYTDFQDKSVKDLTKFIPNFDQQLNSQETTKQVEICKAVLSNLPFFFDGSAGGRSHCYVLNLLISSISSKNEELSVFALQQLKTALPLLASPNWMIEESQAATARIAGQVSEITQKMAQAFNSAEKTAEKAPEKLIVDHKNPITGALTPFLVSLLSGSQSGRQISQILQILSLFAPFFSDDQIGRILLPAVNSSLENVEKYSVSIAGFAEFTRNIFSRCSGRTLSVMFLPRLLKMAYSDVLKKEDLGVVLEVSEVVFGGIMGDKRGQQQAQPAAYVQPQNDEYGEQNYYAQEEVQAEQVDPYAQW